MTCPTCAIPLTGCYDAKCARCVAQMVIASRLMTSRQKVLIEVSRRTPDGAREADILAQIKVIDGGQV